MALVDWVECGKEISDQAASCPGCGAPMNVAPAVTSDHVKDLKKDVKMLGRSAEYRAGHEMGEGISGLLMWLAGNKYMALFWFWLASVFVAFQIGGLLGITEETVSESGYGLFLLVALLSPVVLVYFLRKPIQKIIPPVLMTVVGFGLIGVGLFVTGGLIYIAYRMLSG